MSYKSYLNNIKYRNSSYRNHKTMSNIFTHSTLIIIVMLTSPCSIALEGDSIEAYIQKMHTHFEEAMPELNRIYAGKKIDAFTTIKSISYNRATSTITYNYDNVDELITSLKMNDAQIEQSKENMKSYHIKQACTGEMRSRMRFLGLNIAHNFGNLMKIRISERDCKNF